VVDDEPSIVNHLRRVLPRRGFDVTSVTSPLAALDRSSASPEASDLVITDRTIPRMTGEELAEHLRRIRPMVPIIITSGKGTPEVDDKALLGTVVLAKPFDVADLMAAIEQARRRSVFSRQ